MARALAAPCRSEPQVLIIDSLPRGWKVIRRGEETDIQKYLLRILLEDIYPLNKFFPDTGPSTYPFDISQYSVLI